MGDAEKENMNKSTTQADIDKVFASIDAGGKGKAAKPSIEQIYQKKTQLEHILLRPDTYIGSVEKHTTLMWVYDIPEGGGEGEGSMVQREIEYVPGLYKIFDEILVNAADNKQRDPSMTKIQISISPEKNEISVWNNGKGIPVAEHKEYKVYVPELIFGTLLTSSNYNDDQQKVTGGRNGYGAKLCNIFSTKFTVETSCKEHGKSFKQTWTENMSKPKKEARISASVKDDFTKVTFCPDLAKFGMERLDKDIVALMQRRAFDVAGSTKGISVFLNGKQLPVKGFKAYVEQYLKGRSDEAGDPLKIVFEEVSDRWQVAVAVSDKGFQQVSFVNSIATTKGGRHVDYVADGLTSKLIEKVKKDLKKGNMTVKPFQIKQHMWIFVNALIVNPTFDSQTKENMTTVTKNFGSKCELSEKFVTAAGKCGITDAVLNWVRFKQQEQLEKKSGKKTSKLKVAKLEDANDAGTKNSANCTLILTEGDSAKTLAVSGLAIVGRDTYGVFPLKGKCLNTREATHKQIMENAEINAIIKILGLNYKKKYATEEEVKSLRYGKLMVMADQDQDGSHIKGLIINFIHHSWPALVRQDFIEEFITPIVKATKGREELPFFSIPEYLNWKKDTANWHTYRVKYYKGLGTSTAKEAKEYFSDMRRHRIPFRYAGASDDSAIELAFSKKLIEERKAWLSEWMSDRRTRRETGVAEDHLYNADTRAVSYADFVNKELVLFSNMDNERSIPSLVDGFKPGQRKVLFTCFKRNDKKEVKVAQLAGAVAEHSEYHHGEASLMGTIVNLAQNYVGSNNINVLLPIGQFGTRLQGGKDSASPRYIFTKLSPVTRTLFHPDDDNVLRYLFEDNHKIEPEWYCPIIPMVLVNGASGIGTGWSTSVPNYNPRDIVANIRRLLDGEEPQLMQPWYKGFLGEIQQLDASRFMCHGEIGILDGQNLEITELPVKTWTEAYKTGTLDTMLGGDAEKKLPQLIQDYRDNTTDTSVKFQVRLSDDQMRKAEAAGLHKHFKLSTVINTSSMVLFDGDGVLRRFESASDILREFFSVRKLKYIDRKNFLEGMLKAQSTKLTNQARFIMEKIQGKIKLEDKKKKSIVEQLVKGGYDPDPVKAWKEEIKRRELAAGGDVAEDEEATEGEGEEAERAETEPRDEAEDQTAKRLSDFDYLVTMSLIKLSTEEKDKLMKERDDKETELKTLQGKDWKDLWRADLEIFVKALDEQEAKEEKEARETGLKAAARSAKSAKGNKGRGKAASAALNDTKPSATAQRIAPVIDSATKEKYAKLEAAKGRPKGEARGRKKGLEKMEKDLEEDDLYHRLLDKSPRAAKALKAARKPAEKKKSGGETGAVAKRKAEPKPAKAPKRLKKSASETDSEEEEEEEEEVEDDEDEDIWRTLDASPTPPPASKAKLPSKAPAAKAPAKKRAVLESDSESEDFAGPSKAAKTEAVQPRTRPGRNRNPVNYGFDSDDEDEENSDGKDDNDDDDFDEYDDDE